MILAYTPQFAIEPIVAALQRQGWTLYPTDEPEEMLLADTADVIITSPLEYATSLGVVDYALVPEFGIMTGGFAGLLNLMFKQGLTSINTVAVKQPHGFAALVAKIILLEKYDIEPRFLPFPSHSTLDQMLAVADAVLLAGDDAIFDASGTRSMFDLSDEWEDMAETMLPYLVAWGRVGKITEQQLHGFAIAIQEAGLAIPDTAARSVNPILAGRFHERYLRGDIRYGLHREELPGLTTLYRYLFYHGMIQDIPTLKYLPNGEPAEPLPTPPPTPPAESSGEKTGNQPTE